MAKPNLENWQLSGGHVRQQDIFNKAFDTQKIQGFNFNIRGLKLGGQPLAPQVGLNG